MSAGDLDKVDYKILSVLQEDASRSAAEIAEAVGLSQSPCWRRIQRLKDEGYISRVVALLDRHKLGLHLQLFLQVKVAKNDRATLEEFAEAVQALPEVLECHVILGVFDFLLRVVTTDMEAFETFYGEKLARVPHIVEVTSYVAATQIKSTTAWPLHL